MNIYKNSRRNFLAKSIYSAAIIATGTLTKAHGASGEIQSATIAEQAKSLTESSAENEDGVKIIEAENKITVNINGKLFTEYCYKDAKRPYFYPVIGPSGVNVTRNWPMKNGENEEQDHSHQRSLWYAHGSINGVDFWTDGDRNGNTVHDKFLKLESGKDVGIIQSQNKLVASDGTLVCTDTRTHRFYNLPDVKMIDFEVTFHASEGQVMFGDTKEGSMALRLAPTMRLTGPVAQGHIINSEGIKDNDTWGKRAAWCDYYGPVQGEVVGVAIFDNPTNPRHPTWWHVRYYGLFAANPFGISDFEKKPRGTGNMTIPAGQSVTFKYRIYIHKGNQEQGKVAERYKEYVESNSQ